jgi:hypothetical protein
MHRHKIKWCAFCTAGHASPMRQACKLEQDVPAQSCCSGRGMRAPEALQLPATTRRATRLMRKFKHGLKSNPMRNAHRESAFLQGASLGLEVLSLPEAQRSEHRRGNGVITEKPTQTRQGAAWYHRALIKIHPNMLVTGVTRPHRSRALGPSSSGCVPNCTFVS